ncbi:MAG TPA: hypothetical protein VGC20_13595, partial [bacterium]
MSALPSGRADDSVRIATRPEHSIEEGCRQGLSISGGIAMLANLGRFFADSFRRWLPDSFI